MLCCMPCDAADDDAMQVGGVPDPESNEGLDLFGMLVVARRVFGAHVTVVDHALNVHARPWALALGMSRTSVQVRHVRRVWCVCDLCGRAS